jgi:hypothetical protein
MSKTTPSQSAASHARMVPAFHYFGSLLLLIYGLWSFWAVLTEPTTHNAMHAVLTIFLVVLFWYARTFALRVQDRVIRLEERLRFARLLPADMQGRIDEFTMSQLIALRFASDAELPDLARRVLAENITDAKAIKSAIREWRADHHRA